MVYKIETLNIPNPTIFSAAQEALASALPQPYYMSKNRPYSATVNENKVRVFVQLHPSCCAVFE